MQNSVIPRFSAALASLALVCAASDSAIAMPLNLPAEAGIAAPGQILEVRYRRSYRRYNNNNGGAAVLGLFGAVLGGVITNQRYNDYSEYNYGRRYEYGYSPSYVYGPSYGGGWRRGGGYYDDYYYGRGRGYRY